MKELERITSKLIGVTGGKGVGKDTVANHLVEVFGFKKFSFADPLKRALAAMFDVDVIVFDDPQFKETPMTELLGNTPRRLMQTLGTEWGRDTISPTLWSDILFHAVEKSLSSGASHVVVSDVRFDSEAEVIRARGGFVWHISRDDAMYGVGDTHRSEAGISRTLVDTHIRNSTSKRMLFAQVGVAIGNIDRRTRSNNG